MENDQKNIAKEEQKIEAKATPKAKTELKNKIALSLKFAPINSKSIIEIDEEPNDFKEIQNFIDCRGRKISLEQSKKIYKVSVLRRGGQIYLNSQTEALKAVSQCLTNSHNSPLKFIIE